jgi:transposase
MTGAARDRCVCRDLAERLRAENGFAKIKQFRSVATRYDKSVRSFAAQVAIACNR